MVKVPGHPPAVGVAHGDCHIENVADELFGQRGVNVPVGDHASICHHHNIVAEGSHQIKIVHDGGSADVKRLHELKERNLVRDVEVVDGFVEKQKGKAAVPVRGRVGRVGVRRRRA
ncbi:hypothetical protein CHUV2995_03095 [Corynebacterium diphtheriae subsp. lausannense]|nr:hypothetical protein CHUV2995_03095 [Corynebacterium diphtheriae subsp. lausannense]